MDEHFDVVVVGSGFGGSVTASRLAEAGRRVLVLERGKAYPPGSFPRSPLGLKNNFWDPSEGLQGMFDLWSFDGLEALVSSGLGGGSLIYANVMIRKDEHWFVHEDLASGGYEYWPVSRAQLDPHYDRVEGMLDAQAYPYEHEPYSKTPKTRAFEAAARKLGQDWFLPKLAVTFPSAPGAVPVPGEPIVEPLPNIHGRTRQTCRLVGECDLGCNYGAKNTLDYNYLTAAWRAGAEIRTRSEVRSFEPRDAGGYAIHYVEHDPEREGESTDTSALPQLSVSADRLVLSAGTLGSTYLLLKNRAAFPGLSPRLGTRFSGNGDLLTFAVRCSEVGAEGHRVPRRIEAGYGPVITSAVRVADAADPGAGEGRGFYLEDAGYPEFASWILQAVDQPSVLRRMAPAVVERLVNRLLRRNRDTDMSAEVSALFGDVGLASGVLPLLGMGRDIPDGKMSLADGRLQVDWSKHGASKDYFDRVRDLSRQIAEELGGDFNDDPLWYLNRVITVHSLGGCPMGRSEEEGVVDERGEVFNHPGLHVADGSVMPGPVGPNPSLTIAALADRFADAIIDQGTHAPARSTAAAEPGPGPEPTPLAPRAGAISLAFTEEMKGFFSFDEDDFDRGYRAGREQRRGLMFHLTITTEDLDRFIDTPEHLARAEGYVRSDALGGGELAVERGLFNLFVDQEGDRRRKRMLYRLFFSDAAGHPLTLNGFKVVEDDPGIDNVWSDTSTLFTRLLRGHVEAEDESRAELVGSGILHIHPLDFARQMTTFRTRPAGRVDAVARFGALFAGELWAVYGGRAPGER